MYCSEPSESPVCVMRVATCALHGGRNAKIRNERVSPLQQNVLGLDIAMHNAAGPPPDA